MMTQKRQTALQLTLLAVAMAALVILSAVRPAACTPAAPAGQTSGQAEADDATVEHTATATTAATNPPPPAPTTADTPTPSRTPRLNDNAYTINDYTILALSETAGISGASGATGTASGVRLPDEIYAVFNVRAAHKDDFAKFLRANGANITAMSYGGQVLFAVRARIAPSLLGPATRHPAFVSGYIGGLYPKMAEQMDDAITRYTLGELTVLQAAEKINGRVHGTAPDYSNVVNVVINLEKAGESDALRAFLKANQAGAYPKVAEEFQFIASVPVPVLPRLAQREDVDFITREKVKVRTGIWVPTPEPLQFQPAASDAGQ